MTDHSEPLALLGRALDEVQRLIGATRADQADLPTPCASWNVRQLAGHLVADLGNFATAVRGEKPDWGRGPESLDGDWMAAFSRGRKDLEGAWAGADIDAPVPTMNGTDAPLVSRADQQIAELAVHGWDLAQATAQPSELDSAVAEHGLRWARANLKPEFRGPEDEHKAFGEEVPVAADAPAIDRLAGWFGRDPAWVTPATR